MGACVRTRTQRVWSCASRAESRAERAPLRAGPAGAVQAVAFPGKWEALGRGQAWLDLVVFITALLSDSRCATGARIKCTV